MDRLDIDRVIEMAWEDRTPFEAILSFNYSRISYLKRNKL
jgi:uncharacterized protein (TIGR03643 family)